jgi:GTP-binding protein
MSDSESFVIARGGRGGWGNKHFATPTRQTPHFARPGLPGERRDLTLELKLLADVGLVGFPTWANPPSCPSCQKRIPRSQTIPSPRFSRIWGWCMWGREPLCSCRHPRIIEGASEGAGLGYDFLRHIDRCRLLIHVVDVSASEGRDPVEDLKRSIGNWRPIRRSSRSAPSWSPPINAICWKPPGIPSSPAGTCSGAGLCIF